MRAVAAAEDVATASAVVTAGQERKRASAGGRSAQGSAAVRLPVVSCGSTSDGARAGVPPLVRDDSGDATRAPGSVGSRVVLVGTNGGRCEAGSGVELERIARHVHAAVGAARRGQRGLSRAGQLGRAQNSGNVERLFGLADLLGVQMGGTVGRRDII